MGIRFSSSRPQPNTLATTPGPTLGELPECCVALILGYVDPPQICQLATLNRTFRAASSVDFVWESKLPTNYDVLVNKIFNNFPANLGKREIYATLCHLILLMEEPRYWLICYFIKMCFFWGGGGGYEVCSNVCLISLLNWLMGFEYLGFCRKFGLIEARVSFVWPYHPRDY